MTEREPKGRMKEMEVIRAKRRELDYGRDRILYDMKNPRNRPKRINWYSIYTPNPFLPVGTGMAFTRRNKWYEECHAQPGKMGRMRFLFLCYPLLAPLPLVSRLTVNTLAQRSRVKRAMWAERVGAERSCLWRNRSSVPRVRWDETPVPSLPFPLHPPPPSGKDDGTPHHGGPGRRDGRRPAARIDWRMKERSVKQRG